MTVGLVLVCAAIMLVAGELYIEHRATYPPGHQLDLPQQPQTPPALISRAPREDAIEPRRALEKHRAG